MRNKLMTALAAAIAVLVMAPAGAAVTFDPATGTGFVGKGDVQTAYGWNDAALALNAGGVGFVYEASATYQFTCEWVTGEGTRGERTHTVTHKRKAQVQSTVAHEVRRNKQSHITGFILTGYGESDEAQSLSCPGTDGTGAQIVEGSVELIGSAADLSVTHTQGTHVIWTA